ncbi:hypothetical protein N008_09105 [Hymenobacter sp. APR13]|nr:hypothetical protein N008_09105 [Hymenobacter sp. APR13]
MTFAINFQDQLVAQAHKIHDIPVDAVLAPELSPQCIATHQLPKGFFRFRGRMAHSPTSVFQAELAILPLVGGKGLFLWQNNL